MEFANFAYQQGGKVTYAPIYYQDLRMDENSRDGKLQEFIILKINSSLFLLSLSFQEHDLSWTKSTDLVGMLLKMQLAFVPN